MEVVESEARISESFILGVTGLEGIEQGWENPRKPERQGDDDENARREEGRDRFQQASFFSG
jgi:hypothetical protein